MIQWEGGSSYDQKWSKKSLAEVYMFIICALMDIIYRLTGTNQHLSYIISFVEMIKLVTTFVGFILSL